MDTLPQEITAIIANYATIGDLAVYNMPAVMLTNRRFAHIIRPRLVDASRASVDARRRIMCSLIEYYILNQSTPGIDFAISLGHRLSDANIATCISRKLDDVLDHILTKYGLTHPQCEIIGYALVERGSHEIIDKLATHGYIMTHMVIIASLTKAPIEILRQILKLREPALDSNGINKHYLYVELILYFNSIENVNDEVVAVDKCELLLNSGILTKDDFGKAVFNNYAYSDYKRENLKLAQMLIDLHKHETRIIRHLRENLDKPNITKMFAQAPFIVINYDTDIK
ncbi:hypothetical protein D5b_00352 [Faustovirus]|nr:hypothetical protein D5b_00352 [Faustovirus]AMN84561.1 hypothetical protein D6_00155 [Faustovirus]AMP44296.1 hypothetical protein PRJ_Dakar_00344 [Faustovirus]